MSQNFKTLASLCSWAGKFESYLVKNPKDRFSRDVARVLTPLVAPCVLLCSSATPRNDSIGDLLLFFFDRSLSCSDKCSILVLVTSSTLVALKTYRPKRRKSFKINKWAVSWQKGCVYWSFKCTCAVIQWSQFSSSLSQASSSSIIVCTNSEGSSETIQMHSLSCLPMW